MISKSPIISVNVASVYPENGPVFISSASQLTLIDSKADAANKLSELEKSLETMSLAGENISSIGKDKHISSLQKAYEAMFEVVCFPFLYKDWIEKLNIQCPKGVLLYGPPGVGKTFLVSSVAKRCNAKMFIIQGPEVFGPFIGESEEKLRAKFTEAGDYAVKENVPVILFIDEIVRMLFLRDFIYYVLIGFIIGCIDTQTRQRSITRKSNGSTTTHIDGWCQIQREIDYCWSNKSSELD